MIDYINISSFLIGCSTAIYSLFAIYILCIFPRRTRFHTMVGIILAVWAVWTFKDIILTFPGMYRSDVLMWIGLVDGWSALTYAIFISEVTMPGWTTWRRLALLSIPFAVFTAAYIVWPRQWLINAYWVFLWCFAWFIVIFCWVTVKRYLRYIRTNFSNLDKIDISWLRPVFLFAIVSQLSWFFLSYSQQVVADIIYYFSSIIMWLLVLYYSWNFRPIKVEEMPAAPAPKNPAKPYPFAEGELEEKVNAGRLYLNRDFTLVDLARCMSTNRTYVSNYLSQVRHQTFYDYINELRIQRAAVPLMREHPEFTLEYVATQSGFSSISTFRRAFMKFVGVTPGQFGRDEDYQTLQHD